MKKGVKNMSYIKRWLEENIDNISDEELLSSGFEPEEILLMRDSFGTKKRGDSGLAWAFSFSFIF